MSRVVNKKLNVSITFGVEPNYGPELPNSFGSLVPGGGVKTLRSSRLILKLKGTLLRVIFLAFHEPHEQRNPHGAVSSRLLMTLRSVSVSSARTGFANAAFKCLWILQ